MKEHKEGIVVQPSESTDREEQEAFPSRSASSLEVLKASEELVARKGEWSERSSGFTGEIIQAVIQRWGRNVKPSDQVKLFIN